MTEKRRTPLPGVDDLTDLHGGKILRLPGYEEVPGHLRLIYDERRLLARLDRVAPARLAAEALALLKPLTAAAAEAEEPAVPLVDDPPDFPGRAELDAVVAVLHEQDTDEPGSPRHTARLAIAGYLAHRAVAAAEGHRHESGGRPPGG